MIDDDRTKARASIGWTNVAGFPVPLYPAAENPRSEPCIHDVCGQPCPGHGELEEPAS